VDQRAQRSATDRLRGLTDAWIALSSELSLDAVLEKLLQTAATLTGRGTSRWACSTARRRRFPPLPV
jgi:hypothetical protein